MDAAALARAFIQELSTHQFASAFARFDGRMQAAVPLLVLQSTWRSATVKIGRLRQCGAVDEARHDDYQVLSVPCEFERGTYRMVLWVRQGRIGGMSVRHQDDAELAFPGGIR